METKAHATIIGCFTGMIEAWNGIEVEDYEQ